MDLLNIKLNFEESLIHLQQSIENLTEDKCIEKFANYVYENYSLNTTEKKYVQIIEEHLYAFLQDIIIKKLINKKKEELIVDYVELILNRQTKSLEKWNSFDLQQTIKIFYDETEFYSFIKTFLNNCLITLKNDYTKAQIAELEKLEALGKETIEKYNSEISDIEKNQEEIKTKKELLLNSLKKKEDLISLEDIKKDIGIQADEAPQGYKTQTNQTDGEGKDDIVQPVVNTSVDTSDLKTGIDVSINTEKNQKEAATNTTVELKEVGIGDETV